MNNLPKCFDLLKVGYENGAGSCLAYAPVAEVPIGSKVETSFGVGTVADKSHYHTPDEPVIRLLRDVVTIDRVLWKLQEIIYEEVEDGLPTE